MILIVSDEIDQTTNSVIDWLIQQNLEYIRINSDCFFHSTFIRLSSKGITISFANEGMRNEIDVSEVSSFWYRKGDFTYDYSSFLLTSPKGLKKDVYEHLFDEWHTIKNFFFDTLGQKKNILGNYFEGVSNKLSYLKLAMECKLLVPDTYVCNERNQVYELFKQKQNDEFITKSVQDIFNSVYQGYNLYTYTSLISVNDIKDLPNTFFPSLIQQKINKKYELRIFFMNDKFYPMAIFSQQDNKTKIDFRNYNREKPNRTVPYKLPDEIEKKLTKFIHSSQLNTGSIDMIVSPANEYYFLEVNPSGQFGSLSYDCNYYIEKKIANYLS